MARAFRLIRVAPLRFGRLAGREKENLMDVWFVVRENNNDRRVVSAHDCRCQAETAARVFRDAHPVAIAGEARFVVERWTGLDR